MVLILHICLLDYPLMMNVEGLEMVWIYCAIVHISCLNRLP